MQDETLYVVLYRTMSGKWSAVYDGVFATRQRAECFIGFKRETGSRLDYAILNGPITSPEAMRRAEAELVIR